MIYSHKLPKNAVLFVGNWYILFYRVRLHVFNFDFRLNDDQSKNIISISL